ncbi:MAG: hypothetical protein WC960_01110 [Bacteroidales bacterium]
MRKIFLSLLIFFTVGAISAQEYSSAIGLRIGSSIGASYKQFLNTTHAIEGIVDLDIIGSENMKVKASALYQFHFPTGADRLSWYFGPGASAGIFVGEKSGFVMSIDGVLGIEYKFYEVPIALSFDWNPKVQIISDAGFIPQNFGLTVRFTL